MKKFSKIIILLMIVLLPLNSLAQGESDPLEIRVLHNGNQIEFEKPAYLVEDTLFLPLGEIFQLSGYDFKLEGSRFTITKDGFYSSSDLKNLGYDYCLKDGHAYIDSDFFKRFQDINFVYDESLRLLAFSSLNLKEGDIHFYDLGYRQYEGLNYKLQGAIGVNPKENSPIVFIIHGVSEMPSIDGSRLDLGFNYLMKALMEEGYTPVSINVVPQYYLGLGSPILAKRYNHIFEESLKELIRANEGGNNFKLDLKNKLDFENAFLIGHSRGGHLIFETFNNYREDPRINIKGLIGVTPALVLDMDYSQVDVPVAIINSELDGDVLDLEGQKIFDDLKKFAINKPDHQAIYLYGANHNNFNQFIIKNDSKLNVLRYEIDKIFNNQEEFGKTFLSKTKLNDEDYKPLEAKRQRQFLINYSKKFIGLSLEGKKISQNLGYDKPITSGKFLGLDALLSQNHGGFEVYRGENLDNLSLRNVESKILKSSYRDQENTMGYFNHPGMKSGFKALNLKWNKLDRIHREELHPRISFKNEPLSDDYFNGLNLYLGQDSTYKSYSKKDLSIRIEIEDSKNNKANLRLDKPTALKQHRVKYIKEIDRYSNFTPLSSLDLDLLEFENIDGLDLSDIKYIRLFPDPDTSSSLMLKSIELYRREN